jgi:hypothetical protein
MTRATLNVFDTYLGTFRPFRTQELFFAFPHIDLTLERLQSHLDPKSTCLDPFVHDGDNRLALAEGVCLGKVAFGTCGSADCSHNRYRPAPVLRCDVLNVLSRIRTAGRFELAAPESPAD